MLIEVADEKVGAAAIVYKAGGSACGLAFEVNLRPKVSATILGLRIFLLDWHTRYVVAKENGIAKTNCPAFRV